MSKQSQKVKATAQAVYDAVHNSDSVRAVIFAACENAFHGSVVSAGPRSALVGAARLIIKDYQTGVEAAVKTLNADLKKAGEDKDSKGIAQAAYTRSVAELARLKNRYLDCIRIYAKQWLREHQKPLVASGITPRFVGLRFSLSWLDKTDKIECGLVESDPTKPSQVGKGKGRKAQTRVSGGKKVSKPSKKGSEDSTAYGPRIAVIDAFNNWLDDPTPKLTEALAKFMKTYREAWEADRKQDAA